MTHPAPPRDQPGLGPAQPPGPAPAPTVRRRQASLAGVLGRAAAIVVTGGVAGAAGMALLGRRHLAAEIAVAAIVLVVLLLAAAAATSARRPALNPGPVIAGLAVVVLVAAWAGLSLLGLRGLHPALLALAGWAAFAALRTGRRHRHRRRAHARWAQALAADLAQVGGQSLGQVEQVSAGLTGKVHRDRITAPHLGMAPHAAWSLRITQWEGPRIRQAILTLPTVADITSPDLLLKIRKALTGRVGVAGVRLSTDPLRDEITITVLDTADDDAAEEQDVRARAIERAETVTGQVLKGSKASLVVLDDEQAARMSAGAHELGAGEALREFVITYDTTRVVTWPENRAKITAHVSMQLYGSPDKLAAVWDVARDRVLFRRRREFPALIPHRIIDTTALYGDQVVLPFAEDEDGQVVVYPLSKTALPHGLVIGKTGGGKTVLLVTLAIEAARQGVLVWGCDPKRIELMGLRGWPNVERVATRIPAIVKTIQDFHGEMLRRYEKIETGQNRPSDFRRILLILDEYYVFVKLLADWWLGPNSPRTKEDSKVHPVIGMIGEIAAMSRSAGMHMVIGVQRPDAAWFDAGARDNFGFRVSLGPLDHDAARMLWGDYNTGTDVPAVQGLCTATAPGGPVRAKCHWTPNPADMLTGDLPPEHVEILRSLLPPGSEWDGPLPAGQEEEWMEGLDVSDDAAEADPVTALLSLIRIAMRTGMAHLTDGDTGDAPAGRLTAPVYGWTHSSSGRLEPTGAWIGCAADRDGRRVYLYPARAYAAAVATSKELGLPFNYTLSQLQDALLNTPNLLRTDDTKDGRRGTVRRQLPGNDLDGDDRQRVWDLPEDAVLGQDRDPADTAPASRDLPGPAAVEPEPDHEPAAAAASASAPPAGYELDLEESEIDAGQLIGGERIVLTSIPEYRGPAADAIVQWSTADPRNDARVVIDYVYQDGTPGAVTTSASQRIRIIV
jgi:hypothetical protein